MTALTCFLIDVEEPSEVPSEYSRAADLSFSLNSPVLRVACSNEILAILRCR